MGVDAFTGGLFCFDPWALYAAGDLTNPNVLLAGVIGQGKSALAKSLAVRAIAAGRPVYVPGDPKGEWAPVARAVGGTVVRLGPGLATRLNPLDVTPGADASASRGRLLAAVAALTLHREIGASRARRPGRRPRPARNGAARHRRSATSWTRSAHPTGPRRARTVSASRIGCSTGAMSRTGCGVWSAETWPGCSTDHRPTRSTPTHRWSCSTCPRSAPTRTRWPWP